MIIRNIQQEDDIPLRYWPLQPLRPGPISLVAVDGGKIVGLLWLADGGLDVLIGVYLSAEPYAAWSLCNAARKLARDKGCRALMAHVSPGRLLEAFASRGGTIIPETTHIVTFSTGGD